MGLLCKSETQKSNHMSVGYIYALADPNNPKLPRYIGRTCTSLKRRLSAHRCWAKSHTHHPFAQWLIEVYARGTKPIAFELERCDVSVMQERETAWIRFFRPLGSLTNRSDGDGHLGLKVVRSPLNIAITSVKLREANERSKKRVIGEDGREFASMADAVRSLGVSRRAFNQALKEGWRVRGQYWSVINNK